MRIEFYQSDAEKKIKEIDMRPRFAYLHKRTRTVKLSRSIEKLIFNVEWKKFPDM